MTTSDRPTRPVRRARRPRRQSRRVRLTRTLVVFVSLALVATAVSEGLMVINASAAVSCFAAYQDLRCTELQSTVPDAQAAIGNCSGLFTGNIPFGERCDMTAECMAHYFCLSQGTDQNVSSLSGSGSLGTCYPYALATETCNTTSDCDPSASLICDPVTFRCVAASS